MTEDLQKNRCVLVGTLIQKLDEASTDALEKPIKEALIHTIEDIAGQFFSDIHRIANALETLATPKDK